MIYRVDVTDEDIRAAKRIWIDARDRGAPDDVVATRYQDYVNLVRAQARQLAEAVRDRRGTLPGGRMDQPLR